MPVDVHFEKDRNRHAVFPAEVRNDVRRRVVVENDLEVAPAFTERDNLGNFLRGDPDGVEKIRDAVRKEVFGFQKRRDAGGALGRFHLAKRNSDRLVGLEVRAKRHAEAARLIEGAVKVLVKAFFFDHEGGRRNARVGEREAEKRSHENSPQRIGVAHCRTVKAPAQRRKKPRPLRRGERGSFSGCRWSGDYLIDFTALSAETTPETMAQEFIMAVKLSAPLAPPTTQPAP